MSFLPNMVARRLVSDWVTTCRTIAARDDAAPFVSLSHADDRYLVVLQQMIADKLEEIIAEVNQNP